MEWEDIKILRKKGFSFQKAFEEQNREIIQKMYFNTVIAS